MLYKKIHRQFLRDFGKDDKEIKYSKPYIDNRTRIIFIKTDHGEHYIHWSIIKISGSYKGRIHMTVPPRFEQKIELWFRNFKYGDDDRNDDDRNDVGRVEKLRCYIKRFIDNFLDNLRKVERLGIVVVEKCSKLLKDHT